MAESAQQMTTMVINEPSPQFALCMNKQSVPVADDNELLVAIEYVALNHIDAKLAAEGFCHWQYPHVLGLDAVGTVLNAPTGVFPAKGARVMFNASLGSQGMLKEYATVPNYAVSEVPAEVPSEVAATLPNAGMTALAALDKLQLEEGDSLLIDSGCGAVAHFAIQYAKLRGAMVFVYSEAGEHERLKALGADVVFDANCEGLECNIKHELGPGGFDAILNTCGGDSFLCDLEHLRFCGRIACLNGFPSIPQELLFRRAPNISVVSLGGAWLANSLCAQQKLSFMGQQLIGDVQSGAIIAPDLEVIPFTEAAVRDALTTLYNHSARLRPVVKIQP